MQSEPIRPHAGGCIRQLVFDQADFDAFAALSGDDNAIHVDPEFCARTRFGRPVAHGMLLYTVLQGMLGHLLPNHVSAAQKLMFPAPTFAGEAMTFTLGAAVADGDGLRVPVAVHRVADGVCTCEGTAWMQPAGQAVPAGDAAPVHQTERAHGAGRPSGASGRGLWVGQTAEITRRFAAGDMAAYAALGGEAAGDRVPAPLIGALFSYLLGVKLPGMGTNYLKQETRYPAPALLDAAPAHSGEPLTASVTITALRPEKHLVDLKTVCVDGRNQCVATGRALVYARDTGRFDS
ncbi:MaoC/PaaZ C-terminal domain-containing protein [Yunchengibacter salinarum]|uniref:MaoC/PaaZ C-terminal domain-containing protein n=1 Tax=Yunchengibacter salinarum TaxID=3133399 RepID=UPI0035B5D44D